MARHGTLRAQAVEVAELGRRNRLKAVGPVELQYRDIGGRLTEGDVRGRRPPVRPVGIEYDLDGRGALDHPRGGQHHDVAHAIATPVAVAVVVLDADLRHSGAVRFMPCDLRHGRGDWSVLAANCGNTCARWSGQCRTAHVRACLLRRFSQRAETGSRLTHVVPSMLTSAQGARGNRRLAGGAKPDRRSG